MTDRLLPVGSSVLEVAAARACAELENTPVPIRQLWNADTCPLSLLPYLSRPVYQSRQQWLADYRRRQLQRRRNDHLPLSNGLNMTPKYFALLTHIGTTRLANATALGTRLEITHMAVGDGDGTLPTPDPAQIQLVNEQRCAALNALTIDPNNPRQVIAEQIIPETEGGWWIREIGLLNKAGELIAIANCPESYKPQMQEGSGRIQTIRVILAVSNTAAVT
ncbi:TPA: phage tail protein I, partial [Yersinia enterocolitica]